MAPRTIDRRPASTASLRRDLAALGVELGRTLMVHSSLGAVGWVTGGAPSVVRALIEAIGPGGTLAMPAATPHCADPATWTDPRIDETWLDDVRAELPVFDPRTTPTTMGVIPETFRNWPGTRRSDHPLESVCARGPLADRITREHSLEFCEGRGTPFEQLHELDASVLLLGVGFNRCTALHFAESLAARRRTKTSRFPRIEEGRRVWVEVSDMAADDDTHFPLVGKEYVAARSPRVRRVGEAVATLFPVRELVDFAVAYFERVL